MRRHIGDRVVERPPRAGLLDRERLIQIAAAFRIERDEREGRVILSRGPSNEQLGAAVTVDGARGGLGLRCGGNLNGKSELGDDQRQSGSDGICGCGGRRS